VSARRVAAALVALGAALRLYGFWRPDLWLDEYGTWWTVAGGGWGDVVRRATAIGTSSPLYYLIVDIFAEQLGPGKAALRLASLLFGLGTLALAYPLAIALSLPKRAALFGLAVFALDPRMIWYAQQARPYSMALFLSTLSMLCYCALRRRGRSAGLSAGYVASTAAAHYAHYLFGIVVAAQAAHLLLGSREPRGEARRWLMRWLLTAALVAPSVGHLATIFARRSSLDWIAKLGSGASWPAALGTALDLFDPRLLLLGLVGLAFRFARPASVPPLARPPALLLAWLAAPLLAVALARLLFGVSLFDLRYLLLAAPAALLLTGWWLALGGGEDRRWRIAAPALLLAFALLRLGTTAAASGSFATWPSVGRGWADAARLIDAVAGEDDLILLRSGFVGSDRLASGDRDPVLASGNLWPLAAHRASPRGTVRFLPFSRRHPSLAPDSALMREAVAHRRVVLVGEAVALPEVARRLVESAPFRVRLRHQCGTLQVLLLEKVVPDQPQRAVSALPASRRKG
jgi:hypothetical protein